jgi:hypothetical protein
VLPVKPELKVTLLGAPVLGSALVIVIVPFPSRSPFANKDITAVSIVLEVASSAALLASFVNPVNLGTRINARMARIAITTMSSMSEKPLLSLDFLHKALII